MTQVKTAASRTGLEVTFRHNISENAAGIKINPAQMGALNVTRYERIPKWNCTIDAFPG